MSVTQRFHGRVPNIDRMLYGLIPVRILVPDGRENFVQVVHVRVPYVSPQHSVPLVFLESVLDVVSVKVRITLRRRRSQHYLAGDEVLAGVLHGEGGIGRFGIDWQ